MIGYTPEASVEARAAYRAANPHLFDGPPDLSLPTPAIVEDDGVRRYVPEASIMDRQAYRAAHPERFNQPFGVISLALRQ